MNRWAALALLAGCLPSPPLPDVDGGQDACGQAEQRVIGQLACEGYGGSPGNDREAGTADDESFAEVCRVLEEDPRYSLRPACLASSESCAEADGCAE